MKSMALWVSNQNKTRKIKIVFALIVLTLLFLVLSNQRIQFILGGAFINVGYRFQDHVEQEHFSESESSLNASLVKLLNQNQSAAKVRHFFPRSVKHPKVALLTCMDARIDTVELMGDTRRAYYTVRTAGSVLEPLQQGMFELAIENGVRIIFLTRHTDCSAEKLVFKEEASRYPHLKNGVLSRKSQIQQFLRREMIYKKIKDGNLIVVEALIDTHDGKISLEKVYDRHTKNF